MAFSSISSHFTSGPLVPVVIQNTPNGERSMDLYSRLLDDNIIMFSGEVNTQSCEIAVSQMLYLASKNKETISLYVNSPGGSCTAGLSLIDTMNFIENDVMTVVTGMAASMGSLIATSGTKGKRFMLPNSEHLIHQPLISGGLSGQQTDISIHARHMERTRNRLEKIYFDTNTSGKTLEEIHNACERDNIMDAQEAIAFGLADKIITKRADV